MGVGYQVVNILAWHRAWQALGHATRRRQQRMTNADRWAPRRQPTQRFDATTREPVRTQTIGGMA